ncbi:hypothetical protein D7X94_04275 [Acutalibacter sp. 1XD8-33]|uniref:hypothetical protein n=1 Tax=Acutalibacter sp. 1XD8-33 TaxID=2320081 RepID=UPI000EA0613C|nr:hypothetical protein [Acutalibacter sp. 1XD8-33]RKJ41506.1 hypothetical protein D7X94_04275 [Acutalibacter sp. 1XD8-33]
MGAFTAEEKKSFRLKRHLKARAFDYVLELMKNLILTEMVVWACGGGRFLTGAVMAAGYTLGWALYDIWHYKKEWLDLDIKGDERDG